MGIEKHQAQTKSERLIQSMDRLSANIERLIELQSQQMGTSGWTFGDRVNPIYTGATISDPGWKAP